MMRDVSGIAALVRDHVPARERLEQTLGPELLETLLADVHDAGDAVASSLS